MKMRGVHVAWIAAFLFSSLNVMAQTNDELQFFFTGTAYETNAAGKTVGTPITDQTLLLDRARLGQIADPSTLSIVYHVNGNPMGDTIDIVSNATGQVLVTELGLYFGSDGSLGRTAVTNEAGTAQERIDYIYSDNNSTYTFANDDSIGGSMTSKSIVVTNGGTNLFVSGMLSWGVAPQKTNGPILCIGKFHTGQALF